jgi:ABC-type branched-subunit amino acid transport system ATPase component
MLDTNGPSIKGKIATSSGVVEWPRILLKATNLHKSFGGQKVLNGVSLEIRNGEVILLRGDNGSGKTTLLNILTGCLEPDAGAISYSVDTETEVFKFPRRWWQETSPFDHFLPERVVWEGICRTWQDARLFSSQTLTDNIAVARPNQKGEHPIKTFLRFFSVRKEEACNRDSADALISTLALEPAKSESGDMVSFGHAKLVALARAARTGAKILFLDEPLAGLDDASARNIVRVLGTFVREEGLTLVIVEHLFNIPLIMGLATTVWTLDGGQIVASTTHNQPTKTIADASFSELLKGVSPEPWQVCDIPLYSGAMLKKANLATNPPGAAVLQVEDLVVCRGKRVVVGRQIDGERIEGVSFDIRLGELACLYGPNGWGKTTLLEAITGLLVPTRGTVKLNGKSIDQMPPWKRVQAGISIVRSRNNLFSSLSVEETLRLGNVRVPEQLTHLLRRKMGSLSGGEKRQVALARVATSAGSLDLLDEPFEGLDQASYLRNLPMLRPHCERGILVAFPSASSFSEVPFVHIPNRNNLTDSNNTSSSTLEG